MGQTWAHVTAEAFNLLSGQQCKEVVKPEWWNDEALKALSVTVLRADQGLGSAHAMRGRVLGGFVGGAWEVRSRSVAELKEAATHLDRAAALFTSPAVQTKLVQAADWCRRQAEGHVDYYRSEGKQ